MFIDIDKNNKIVGFTTDKVQEHFIEIPDNHMIRFNGEYEYYYDKKTGSIVEQLQESAIKARKIREASNYLESTDWYVVRAADPGSNKPIPSDVLEKRNAARAILASEK